MLKSEQNQAEQSIKDTAQKLEDDQLDQISGGLQAWYPSRDIDDTLTPIVVPGKKEHRPSPVIPTIIE